ncbi:MAG TPA: GDSL-type esterase/lipase family protein, partial [Candidatus Saccharimonadales bacterium]|nr:GDSL-type esterase/lipase family protein [Candidatus Saccharimonadales bacterium]
EDYLTMCVPQLDISVRQLGWSGEKAGGFLGRMTNDCLRFHPTVATTCYGMNDCEYRPYEDRIGNTYQAYTTDIVQAFKENGVRVILGSPGCVSKVPWWTHSGVTFDGLNQNLCNLRNLDIGIAREEDVRFADLFWPMLTADTEGAERYGPDYAIPGNDGVHPFWAGHLVMAYSFLKAMGLSGDIGTFTINLKKNEINVSDGHKIISAQDGRYEIESSRYPFCPCEPDGLAAGTYPVCGHDSTDSNNSIRSGMTLVPFNNDLNRLMLIVRGTDATSYHVTWGTESKVFTAKQLNHGINLAEEFPSNPFSAAFARVDLAIAAKQAYETFEIKDFFGGANVAQADSVVAQTEQQHDELVAAVHAAFVPVTHVIEITPQ